MHANHKTMQHIALLLGWTLIGAASAGAQNKDATRSYDRSTPGSENIRNFTVRNGSGEPVEWAEVRLSDGSSRTVTNGQVLTDAHSQPVGAPQKACVAEVHVRFVGGRIVDATGLNDCQLSTVTILHDRITTGSSARPGP